MNVQRNLAQYCEIFPINFGDNKAEKRIGPFSAHFQGCSCATSGMKFSLNRTEWEQYDDTAAVPPSQCSSLDCQVLAFSHSVNTLLCAVDVFDPLVYHKYSQSLKKNVLQYYEDIRGEGIK